MRKQNPVIRRGARVPFRVSVAAWFDLLGYGGAVARAEFSPMHSASQRMFKRLRKFHEIVARHSERTFRSFTVNDGAVFYRDLSWRSASVTRDFVMKSWNIFEEVQRGELDTGEPGGRLVLAAGFRGRGSKRAQDALVHRFKQIISRVETGEVTAEHAAREAANHRPYSDVVPELQANFAFTKAYVAEQSGSKGGLPGPNFYIDKVLFSSPFEAEWIESGPDIHWQFAEPKMSATFARIHAVAPPVVSRSAAGIRDGLAVAQALAPTYDVIEALRAIET